MSSAGQIERSPRTRALALFQNLRGDRELGNGIDRYDHRSLERGF
jgi:hypothetical protein